MGTTHDVLRRKRLIFYFCKDTQVKKRKTLTACIMRLGQIIQLVPQCDGGHRAVFGLHSVKAITEALFDPPDVIRRRGRSGRGGGDGWRIHGNKRVHK